MINSIGESAGAVWKYLAEHSEATPSEIKKALRCSPTFGPFFSQNKGNNIVD